MFISLHIVFETLLASWTRLASPRCVVRKVKNSADFDKDSVNGLAVELQSLEERVETIENAVHVENFSLQQVGEFFHVYVGIPHWFHVALRPVAVRSAREMSTNSACAIL